ncbi:phospholipase [Shewanella psychropiezotolerans]|uniref:Phospholipase n=1 Tax=Shewanella psychropiezotolerans TaxID=2593655 RepID=A0ABX5WYN2_9GAMM|nr:sphingomyelin phosphodiesterase [Shewanella psychropiezotolerans]QDO82131.1 phospholipase [Shewanella psychropiezotolerans]
MNPLEKSILALGISVLWVLPALADSDIYVTNNSDQIISVDVIHTGSGRLEKGNEWQQHTDSLGPWETKVVLSFNRWEGVESGQDYNFETRLTNQLGESVSLHQRVEGHWYNSTMKHGASADDLDLQWQDNRDIYRYQTFSPYSGLSELSFKADNTARYDDIYYALTPGKIDEQKDDNEDLLKVMTYNIWALPVIASHIQDRLAILPEYMRGYDVLMLQEVFASGRGDFLRQLAEEYPFQTEMLNKPGVNIYDGGVVLVSRFPIVNQSQYVFPDCTGTDCFTDKGVNYAEVIKGGKAYHLFATHTASFDTDTARDYRQRQFRQIREFASSMNIPANEMVVYGGDFNVNKRKFEDDYANMLANLDASAPEYAGYTESTFDPRVNKFAGAPASGGENVEYLDYIVVSNEYLTKPNNTNRVLVPRTTDPRLWKHWNLSDHFPVTTVLY